MRRAVAAAVGLALVLATPAYAAQDVIRSAGVDGSQVELVVVAPAASRASLRLSIDGVEVPAELEITEVMPDRSVMLLLDSSGSMSGEPIRQAVDAARAFGAAVPADVRIGLTVFSSEVKPLLAPTTDRAQLAASLTAVRADGNTTLYDGVTTAVARLGSSGQRTILVLSDGKDTRSTATLEQASAAVAKAGVTLQVIRLLDAPGDEAPLKALAAAGKGSVVDVTAAERLRSAFLSAAGELSDQVVVRGRLPEGAVGQVTVAVDLTDAGAALHDEAVVLVPTAAAPTTPPQPDATAPAAAPAAAAGRPSLLLAAGLVFLGLFGICSALFSSGAGDRRRRARLIAGYTVRPRTSQEAAPAAPGLLLRAAEAWSRRRDGSAVRDKLERAGLELTPGEWLVRQLAAGLGTTVLLTLLANVVVGVIAGLLVAVLGFRWFLGFKARRRLAAFQADLPDSLQLVASSLGAGYSLPQALDAVVQEGNQPLAGELGRALAEARLGVPVEDALDVVAQRVGSEDFRWTVLAIRIQRSTGGNLSEVLMNVCKTMRERAALRRQVRALSAEGRLSAYILVGLPIGLALYEFSFRREYMRPLYTEPLGITMLVAGVVSMVLGAWWMRKIIDVGD